MKHSWVYLLSAATGALLSCAPAQDPDLLELPAEAAMSASSPESSAAWSQWGHDAQHRGMVPVAGQRLDRRLADFVHDPFVAQEQAEHGGRQLDSPINDIYISPSTSVR